MDRGLINAFEINQSYSTFCLLRQFQERLCEIFQKFLLQNAMRCISDEINGEFVFTREWMLAHFTYLQN
jgi:hypothetical protein